jgi:hypothetical protein
LLFATHTKNIGNSAYIKRVLNFLRGLGAVLMQIMINDIQPRGKFFITIVVLGAEDPHQDARKLI